MKLTVVSLGPGDPSLVTIQGMLALVESSAIIVPTKNQESLEASRTYDILVRLAEYTKNIFQVPLVLKEKKLIPCYNPMRYYKEDWVRQTDIIIDALRNENNVCYVTLGDAGIFSTAYFLLDIIKENYPGLYQSSHVLPGITSFSLASAKIKKPLCLGSTSLEILPQSGNAGEKTTVYMRPIKGKMKIPEKSHDVYTFSKLCFEGEHIKKGFPEEDCGYLTIMIDFAHKAK